MCCAEDNSYSDRTICKMMTLNKIHDSPATSSFLLSDFPLFQKSSFAKHALEYRIISRCIASLAGESGMLLHRKGELTIAKSK
jgi:hypothetical protein